MVEKIINSRIQSKRDSEINWETNNPVLLDGEIIIIDRGTSDVALKIGDGVSNYSDLAFLNVTSLEKPVYNYTEILGLSDKLTDIENKISLIPIIPTGMIMIWSGLQTNIPDGWVLCDGNNGTPNLTDKFILGAGNSYNVNDQGGEASHKLTLDEIPSHKHTGTTEGSGGHNHTIGTDKDTYYVTSGDCWSVHNAATGAKYYNGSTSWVNNHTHSFTTSNVGGGQVHNNMPPYYALCYIMKI